MNVCGDSFSFETLFAVNKEFEKDQISPQTSLLHIYSKSNKRTKEKEILNKKSQVKKHFEPDLPDWHLLQPC